MPKFILWAGSKDKLLPQINERLEAKLPNAQYYLEPFLGGGSVLLSVLEKYPHLTCYANDKNAVLINTWNILKTYPKELAEELAVTSQYWHPTPKDDFLGMDRDTYRFSFQEERAKLNRMIATKSFGLPMAVSFLIVNHMGYNGLFRVNSKGFCNTPPGTYHAFPTKEELLQISALIQNVEFSSEDFSVFLKKFDNQSNTFVYADPPYLPITKTSSFTDYTSGGFGEQEQRDLALLLKKHDFVAHGSWSEELDPFYKEIYSNCNIAKVSARRNINCKGSKRGKIQELIVNN